MHSKSRMVVGMTLLAAVAGIVFAQQRDVPAGAKNEAPTQERIAALVEDLGAADTV